MFYKPFSNKGDSEKEDSKDSNTMGTSNTFSTYNRSFSSSYPAPNSYSDFFSKLRNDSPQTFHSQPNYSNFESPGSFSPEYRSFVERNQFHSTFPSLESNSVHTIHGLDYSNPPYDSSTSQMSMIHGDANNRSSSTPYLMQYPERGVQLQKPFSTGQLHDSYSNLFQPTRNDMNSSNEVYMYPKNGVNTANPNIGNENISESVSTMRSNFNSYQSQSNVASRSTFHRIDRRRSAPASYESETGISAVVLPVNGTQFEIKIPIEYTKSKEDLFNYLKEMGYFVMSHEGDDAKVDLGIYWREVFKNYKTSPQTAMIFRYSNGIELPENHLCQRWRKDVDRITYGTIVLVNLQSSDVTFRLAPYTLSHYEQQVMKRKSLTSINVQGKSSRAERNTDARQRFRKEDFRKSENDFVIGKSGGNSSQGNILQGSNSGGSKPITNPSTSGPVNSCSNIVSTSTNQIATSMAPNLFSSLSEGSQNSNPNSSTSKPIGMDDQRRLQISFQKSQYKDILLNDQHNIESSLDECVRLVKREPWNTKRLRSCHRFPILYNYIYNILILSIGHLHLNGNYSIHIKRKNMDLIIVHSGLKSESDSDIFIVLHATEKRLDIISYYTREEATKNLEIDDSSLPEPFSLKKLLSFSPFSLSMNSKVDFLKFHRLSRLKKCSILPSYWDNLSETELNLLDKGLIIQWMSDLSVAIPSVYVDRKATTWHVLHYFPFESSVSRIAFAMKQHTDRSKGEESGNREVISQGAVATTLDHAYCSSRIVEKPSCTSWIGSYLKPETISVICLSLATRGEGDNRELIHRDIENIIHRVSSRLIQDRLYSVAVRELSSHSYLMTFYVNRTPHPELFANALFSTEIQSMATSDSSINAMNQPSTSTLHISQEQGRRENLETISVDSGDIRESITDDTGRGERNEDHPDVEHGSSRTEDETKSIETRDVRNVLQFVKGRDSVERELSGVDEARINTSGSDISHNIQASSFQTSTQSPGVTTQIQSTSKVTQSFPHPSTQSVSRSSSPSSSQSFMQTLFNPSSQTLPHLLTQVKGLASNIESDTRAPITSDLKATSLAEEDFKNCNAEIYLDPPTNSEFHETFIANQFFHEKVKELIESSYIHTEVTLLQVSDDIFCKPGLLTSDYWYDPMDRKLSPSVPSHNTYFDNSHHNCIVENDSSFLA